MQNIRPAVIFAKFLNGDSVSCQINSYSPSVLPESTGQFFGKMHGIAHRTSVSRENDLIFFYLIDYHISSVLMQFIDCHWQAKMYMLRNQDLIWCCPEHR